MNFGKYFKRIDIFGRNLMFEDEDSQSFSTYVGACLTLIAYIGIISIGFLFGKEIYQRNIPIVTVSNSIKQNSRINLNELPFLFTIFPTYSYDIYDLNNLFDFSLYQYIKTDNGTLDMPKFTANVVKCNSQDFINEDGEQAFIDSIINKNNYTESRLINYCLNFDSSLYIQNNYLNFNSSFVNIIISKCNKNKRIAAKNNVRCFENVTQILSSSNYILSGFFRDSFVDPKNYSHPIIYYENTFSRPFYNGIYNRVYLGFVKDLIETDNSWILENIVRKESIVLKSIRDEISLHDERLLAITLESPKIRLKVTRNYLKIQELFAKIGGLFSAICIMAKILIRGYVKFKFRIEYFKEIAKSESTNNLDKSFCNLKKDSMNINNIPSSVITVFKKKNDNNKEGLKIENKDKNSDFANIDQEKEINLKNKNENSKISNKLTKKSENKKSYIFNEKVLNDHHAATITTTTNNFLQKNKKINNEDMDEGVDISKDESSSIDIIVKLESLNYLKYIIIQYFSICLFKKSGYKKSDIEF